MKTPIKILKEGTTVSFTTVYCDEKVEYEGIIVGNNKGRCVHRNYRDLTYVIKCCVGGLYTVHHSDVKELILCPCCEEDLLDVGVDEKSWTTKTYDRVNRKTLTKHEKMLDDDSISCSWCGNELSKGVIIRLREYLDI